MPNIYNVPKALFGIFDTKNFMKVRRNIILFFSFSLLVISVSQAQRSIRWRRMRYEVIYGAGGTNFLGELGGANQAGTNFLRDFEITQTRPVLSIGMRYKILQDLAVKAGLYLGYLHGDDNTTTETCRHNRNLRFRSPIIEFGPQIEYSILREQIGHRYNLRRVRGIKGFAVNTYFFVGVTGFWFNPQGKLNGKWYNLQPLGTEGQGLIPTRKKYSRIQVAIPYGIGFKYALDREWSIGLEYGVRKTFTDYIDDVSTTYFDNQMIREKYGNIAAQLADPSSGNPRWTAAGQQRGDARDKDSYMFMTITLTYKLRQTRRGLPKLFY